jgi:hypothetical protein
MGTIIVKSMTFQGLAKFSLGSRFVFESLHFIANQLGDLTMHLSNKRIRGQPSISPHRPGSSRSRF